MRLRGTGRLICKVMRRETSCYPCLCPLCQATAHRLQAPALLLHKSGIIFLAYLLARKQKNVFSKTSNGSFKMHTEITWMLSETFSETGKHTTATEKKCLFILHPVISSSLLIRLAKMLHWMHIHFHNSSLWALLSPLFLFSY